MSTRTKEKMKDEIHDALLLLGFKYKGKCKYYHPFIQKEFEFGPYSDAGIIYYIFNSGFKEGMNSSLTQLSNFIKNDIKDEY